MALLLLAEIAELIEGAVTLAEGVASAEAIGIELGAVTEATPILAPLAAAEDAEVSYGAINVSGRAAQAYQNVSQAYGAGAMVLSGAATAADKIYDSAMKANENRKRKRGERERSRARKRLPFELNTNHIHRCIKPGRAEGLVGFPNTYTSTMHAYKPVVTT
jgi:hypothetical protein